MIRRALRDLRADERLSEMEPLLAFFATFVLDSELVKQIMRWDMAVLMQSPWYQEILEEGEQRGRLDGARQALLVSLDVRLGPVPPVIAERIRAITDPERLEALLRLALTAGSLAEFEEALG